MTFQTVGFSLPQTGLFIDGVWRDGAGVFPVHNPADGSLVAEVANGSAGDATNALDAAVRAQPSWSRVAPRARASLMHAAHRLMLDRENQIVRTMTLESGKPLTEAKAEFNLSVDFLALVCRTNGSSSRNVRDLFEWRISCCHRLPARLGPACSSRRGIFRCL